MGVLVTALVAALLGAGLGPAASALGAQPLAFLWPAQAPWALAGAGIGLLWALGQGLLWRAAFGWTFAAGARLGALSLLPCILGWLAPWVPALPLPYPHDFAARKLQILMAAQGLGTLSLAYGLGLWRLRRERILQALSPRSLALRLGALSLLAYLLSGVWIGQWNNTGDAPHYVLMAHSLLHDGDVDLSDEHVTKEWRQFYDRDDLVKQVPDHSDGRQLPEHKPGLSALMLPTYAFFGLSGARWALGALAATGAGLFVLLLLHSGLDRRQGLLGFSLLAFGAPWWTQSQLAMPELPGGVGLLLVLAAWRGILPRAWAYAAFLLLTWLSVRYWPLVGALALMDAWLRRKEGWRAWIQPFVWGAIGLVGNLIYNHALFGSISPAKTYEDRDIGWDKVFNFARIPVHVSGLLIDQEFGWLPYSPVALLSFLGLEALWRRDRTLFWQTALPAAVYLGPIVAFPWWWSAMAPNRYLVCLAPFFTLWALEAWRAWGANLAFRALATASLAWGILLAVLPWFCWSKGEGANWILRIVGQALGQDLAPWFPSFMVPRPLSWAWVALLIGGLLWARRRLGRPA